VATTRSKNGFQLGLGSATKFTWPLAKLLGLDPREDAGDHPGSLAAICSPASDSTGLQDHSVRSSQETGPRRAARARQHRQRGNQAGL